MKAHITIDRGLGKKEHLVLPVLQETTSGFTCGTDPNFRQPKSEWFPKHSKQIQSHLIKE